MYFIVQINALLSILILSRRLWFWWGYNFHEISTKRRGRSSLKLFILKVTGSEKLSALFFFLLNAANDDKFSKFFWKFYFLKCLFWIKSEFLVKTSAGRLGIGLIWGSFGSLERFFEFEAELLIGAWVLEVWIIINIDHSWLFRRIYQPYSQKSTKIITMDLRKENYMGKR